MKNPAAFAVVWAALEFLANQDGLEDDPELMDTLSRSGFETQDAARLVALLPIAFGRALLQQMGVLYFRDYHLSV